MVVLRVSEKTLVVTVKGIYKLLAFRHQLQFSLENVQQLTGGIPSSVPQWKGLRAPGTHIPGIIVAGTFYEGGRRTFWAVRKPNRALTIDLSGESYDRLIVQVDDPQDARTRIRNATIGSEKGERR